MEAPIEPHLLKPWSWFFGNHRPNKIPLYLWAKFFLALCTSEICGEPSKETKSERINLFQADLRESFFGTDTHSLVEGLRHGFRFQEAHLRLEEIIEHGTPTDILEIPYKEYRRSVDLHKADLRFANLSKSYMYDVNLYGADLRGANLADADLSGADLVKADLRFAELKGTKLFQTYLHGADLRKAKGLTQTQLEKACIDKTTKLPSGFERPQPSELCELADMAVWIKHQYGSKPELLFSSPADASLP